jgi:hypothetical protein
LEEQGRKNPVAYLMLLKTVMPLQVAGVDGQPIMVITGVVRDGGWLVTIAFRRSPKSSIQSVSL